jgi:hypothetical protein
MRNIYKSWKFCGDPRGSDCGARAAHAPMPQVSGMDSLQHRAVRGNRLVAAYVELEIIVLEASLAPHDCLEVYLLIS